MNRRGFLTSLFATAGGIIVAPSIVTHGLKLKPYGLKLLSEPTWSSKDIELYERLPFYLAKLQIERSRTNWKLWVEMHTERKFPANMGTLT